MTTKARDGVIVSHGGSAVGYSLYLKDGRAVFAIRNATGLTRIAAPDPLGETAALEARLAADGAMTLSVDGKTVATGTAKGTLHRQPQEDFCVGHDAGVTVDDYDGKALFQGSTRKLAVSTSPAAP